MNPFDPITRRKALQGFGAAGLLGMLPTPLAAGVGGNSENRLIVVVLRGGLDGLSVAVPYGDPAYYRHRPNIALPRPGNEGGVLRLTDLFGLHPVLRNLHQMWRDQELAVLPAIGTPDRTRSHFDAQDTLENGMSDALGARDGWLYRVLRSDGAASVSRNGLAIGRTVPLLMRGAELVQTWAPTYLPGADAAFVDQLQQLYARNAEFSALLASARNSAAAAGGMSDGGDRQSRSSEKEFAEMCTACGRLLAAADGPRVASLELGGWDTHTGQDFFLRRQLAQLDDGMGRLKKTLGPAWRHTAVMIISEFGRTVRENGGRGTDHGTGGVALLAGGAVNGGRIATPWPGLQDTQLFENRDLMAVTDLRRVLKGVLQGHLGAGPDGLAQVFPDCVELHGMDGLVRNG